MASYLITGSSRGLGLTLATFLSQRPSQEVRLVVASARTKTPALQNLIDKNPGRVAFAQLETNKSASVDAAVSEVQKILGSGAGLDVLINNAGILTWTEGGAAAMTDLMNVLDVNVNGVHLVTTAFLPLLRQGTKKLVINVSTTMGSITRAHTLAFQKTPAYKVSKAALNMLNKQYALDLAKEDFTFVVLSPGWLQTDMGTQDAHLPVETGAKAVLEIVDHVTKADNGKFFDIHVPEENEMYPGGEVPW